MRITADKICKYCIKTFTKDDKQTICNVCSAAFDALLVERATVNSSELVCWQSWNNRCHTACKFTKLLSFHATKFMLEYDKELRTVSRLGRTVSVFLGEIFSKPAALDLNQSKEDYHGLMGIWHTSMLNALYFLIWWIQTFLCVCSKATRLSKRFSASGFKGLRV